MDTEQSYTVEQRTKIGVALYYDIEEGRNQFARETAVGHGDTEIRMAIYWALHDEKFADPDNPEDLELLFAPGITQTLNDLKARARASLVMNALETMSIAQIAGLTAEFFREGDISNELAFKRRDRLQQEAKQREAQTRSAFNAQHKPAPEGTVKELAQKYNKSLSEIRRLKAAGELHTLVLP
ncbi:hypothetical protein V0M98_37895 (plasmid) [Pseudomonas silesiensis]|uniref:hypothetical protein n=1 Tax=Pseudomonas silesiensis TaxID=1853130 RepID=UPI0030CA5CEA